MHFTLTDLTADITQNGAESGAKLLQLEVRETVISGNPAKSEFRFIVRDNGKGMSGAGLEKAMDPFVTDGVKHPGRKVGLGLPFLVQTAIQSGGGWQISSVTAAGGLTVSSGGEAAAPAVVGGSSADGICTANGSGTVVEAWFDLNNVDTPPVGDIPGLFRTVLMFNGPEEIVLKRSRKGDARIAGAKAELDYEVKKTELTEALGGDLEELSALVLLGKYLHSLEGDEDA